MNRDTSLAQSIEIQTPNPPAVSQSLPLVGNSCSLSMQSMNDTRPWDSGSSFDVIFDESESDPQSEHSSSDVLLPTRPKKALGRKRQSHAGRLGDYSQTLPTSDSPRLALRPLVVNTVPQLSNLGTLGHLQDTRDSNSNGLLGDPIGTGLSVDQNISEICERLDRWQDFEPVHKLSSTSRKRKRASCSVDQSGDSCDSEDSIPSTKRLRDSSVPRDSPLSKNSNQSLERTKRCSGTANLAPVANTIHTSSAYLSDSMANVFTPMSMSPVPFSRPQQSRVATMRQSESPARPSSASSERETISGYSAGQFGLNQLHKIDEASLARISTYPVYADMDRLSFKTVDGSSLTAHRGRITKAEVMGLFRFLHQRLEHANAPSIKIGINPEGLNGPTEEIEISFKDIDLPWEDTLYQRLEKESVTQSIHFAVSVGKPKPRFS